MKMENLQTLLADELADLLSAENQLIKALPKLVKAANSQELKECFEDHLEETRTQAERLEKIISEMGDSAPRSKTCKGMEGLIKEGEERTKASGEPSVIDAGLIAAAQRVEHYEIAGYGCARTFAEMLGMNEAARLLDETIEEEKAANEKLNQLALNMINQEAAEV